MRRAFRALFHWGRTQPQPEQHAPAQVPAPDVGAVGAVLESGGDGGARVGGGAATAAAAASTARSEGGAAVTVARRAAPTGEALLRQVCFRSFELWEGDELVAVCLPPPLLCPAPPRPAPLPRASSGCVCAGARVVLARRARGGALAVVGNGAAGAGAGAGAGDGVTSWSRSAHPRRSPGCRQGEFGAAVGAVYTSFTGFYSVSGAGTVQLLAMAKLLHAAGYEFWDLGEHLFLAPLSQRSPRSSCGCRRRRRRWCWCWTAA
jgi:hypothetical protein